MFLDLSPLGYTHLIKAQLNLYSLIDFADVAPQAALKCESCTSEWLGIYVDREYIYCADGK